MNLIASPIKIVWAARTLLDSSFCLDEEAGEMLSGNLSDLTQLVVCPGQDSGLKYHRGNRQIAFSVTAWKDHGTYLAALTAAFELLKTHPQSVAAAAVTLHDWEAGAAATPATTWSLQAAEVMIADFKTVSNWLSITYSIKGTKLI